jgi:Secretion system C-terminal sorting domain
LHYDYPVDGGPTNQVMGIYRHIVDYMAHPKLGGNTLVYIVDGIWSGNNWSGGVEKWQMAPFNNDWTSSLFFSQDPVAIESVGFDFLYNEYLNYPASHGNANFPLVEGVQDYIHQAADPKNWPAGIKYDPSSANHSSPVGSLGVHEHWNNMTDKQYSRNLGTGSGIELVGVPSSLVVTSIAGSSIEQANAFEIFPNPVKDVATLKYTLTNNANVHVELLSIDGKLVANSGSIWQLAGKNNYSINIANFNLTSGTYICKVITRGSSVNIFTSKILIK